MSARAGLAAVAVAMLLAACAGPSPPATYAAIARDIVAARFDAEAATLATIHNAADGQGLTVWRVSGDDVQSLRSWRLDGGRLGADILLSGDGNRVVVPASGGGLAAVGVASGRRVSVLDMPRPFDREAVAAGAFGPEGMVALAMRPPGAALLLFEVASGRLAAAAPLPGDGGTAGLMFSRDGRHLLRMGAAPAAPAALWTTRPLRRIAAVARHDGAAVFLADRDALALAAPEGTLRLMTLPELTQAARFRSWRAERGWRGPLVSGPDALLGLITAGAPHARDRFRVFHLDRDALLPLLDIDLYADAAHAIGVTRGGEWRLAATSGVLRFASPGAAAVGVERRVAEARRLLAAGLPRAAGETLLAALALDPERLGERGADLMRDHPALAGEVERRRAILLRGEEYTAHADGRPLFIYGYLALLAGHPDIARTAARRLRGDGSIPTQFDGPALAGYLDALVAAWGGRIDEAMAHALAARELANPGVGAFLAERIRAHPRAWGPLLAERRALARATGVPLALIPTSVAPPPQPLPFPRPDGTLAEPR